MAESDDVILDESLTLFEGVSCDNPFVHNLSYSERYVRTNYVVQTSTPGAYEHRFDLTEVLPVCISHAWFSISGLMVAKVYSPVRW